MGVAGEEARVRTHAWSGEEAGSGSEEREGVGDAWSGEDAGSGSGEREVVGEVETPPKERASLRGFP